LPGWREFTTRTTAAPILLPDRGWQSLGFTTVLYFTSEAEAREGERKEPPPELKAQMEEMDALSAEPPRFYDLKRPWLYSPE